MPHTSYFLMVGENNEKKGPDRAEILGEEYRTLVEAFDRAFAKIREKQKVKHIHRLRVSVKKMRAIWKILDASNAHPPDETLRVQVGSIFSAAGRLRESQVNQDIVSGHKLQFLSGFHDHLIISERRRIQELKEVMEDIDPIDLHRRQRKVIKWIAGLHTFDIPELVSGCISDEYRQAVDVPDAESGTDLHTVRKHIRNMDTLLELLIRLDATAEIEDARQGLKPLMDQLGKWHDDLVLLEELDLYIEEIPDGAADIPLTDFRAGLQKRLDREAVTLRNSLESLRSQFALSAIRQADR